MSRCIALFCLLSCPLFGQYVGADLPATINRSQTFLFYFHGAVVTAYGDNAISKGAPEWGPYEYSKILDSLRARGFNVISERRKPEIPDQTYVAKLVNQISTLLRAGVSTKNIVAVGASAGWNIVIRAAAQLRNPNLCFVIMGGCWPGTHKQYEDLELYGHFLSIIEASDPHGSCDMLFENRKTVSSHEEIRLNTGRSHGFIYKASGDWIDPIVNWLSK